MKTFFLSFFILIPVLVTSGKIGKVSSDDSNKTILEADKEVYFDDSIQKLVATPNARLKSGPILLTAERIEYDTNTSEALAIGKVILTDGNFRLLAEKTMLNMETGDFNATEVKTMLYPLAYKVQRV